MQSGIIYLFYFIQGSAMFFTLKVSLKVILKHHQYRRQGFRRVLNYDPSLEPPLSPTPATDETQTSET